MESNYRLYKKEKLCSVRAIDELFRHGGAEYSMLSYPIRIISRESRFRSSDAPIAFLISVPKKRLRHAVDRVQMRRRIREAYRLNHHDFPLPDGVRADVGFVYVADRLTDYRKVERSMRRLLEGLAAHFGGSTEETPSQSDEPTC